MSAMVDLLVEQQHAEIDAAHLNTETHPDWWFVAGPTIHTRYEPLNIPAYQHTVYIELRWSDGAFTAMTHGTKYRTERFEGWGATPDVARAQAVEKYEAWRRFQMNGEKRQAEVS